MYKCIIKTKPYTVHIASLHKTYAYTFGDSCCKCCLAMIYMTNSTHIAMWFVTSKYFLFRVKSLTCNTRKKQLTQLIATLLTIIHSKIINLH